MFRTDYCGNTEPHDRHWKAITDERGHGYAGFECAGVRADDERAVTGQRDQSPPDPRAFVAHLRARADRADARAANDLPGDTMGFLWKLHEQAMRDRAAADDLERFLNEGALP